MRVCGQRGDGKIPPIGTHPKPNGVLRRVQAGHKARVMTFLAGHVWVVQSITLISMRTSAALAVVLAWSAL